MDMDYDKWLDAHYDDLVCECAESGADRELDFNFEDFCLGRYQVYYPDIIKSIEQPIVNFTKRVSRPCACEEMKTILIDLLAVGGFYYSAIEIDVYEELPSSPGVRADGEYFHERIVKVLKEGGE